MDPPGRSVQCDAPNLDAVSCIFTVSLFCESITSANLRVHTVVYCVLYLFVLCGIVLAVCRSGKVVFVAEIQ